MFGFYANGAFPRIEGSAAPAYPAGQFDEAFAGALAANDGGIDTFLATLGANTRIGMEPGTIEGWFKPSGGGFKVLFAHEQWFWVGLNGGVFSAQIGGDGGEGGTNYSISGGSFAADAWHHFAVTFSGDGTVSLYGDGNRVATSSATAITGIPGAGSTNDFILGGLWSAATYDSGATVDELRFSTVERYTGATYTIPAAAFTVDADTAALFRFNGDALAELLDVDVDPEPAPPGYHFRLGFEPIVWDGTGDEPYRHPGAKGQIWICPAEPQGWLPNDIWIRKV